MISSDVVSAGPAVEDAVAAVVTTVLPAAPVTVTCRDGSAVVLRLGIPADTDALAAMHGRCSMGTLRGRYHTGMRTIPHRWLQELLQPPHGLSMLAVCGRTVVALAQLVPSETLPPTAPSPSAPEERAAVEVSVLIEDRWQNKGLGTEILSRLAQLAASQGYGSLVANCLPGEGRVLAAARRAGLDPRTKTRHGEQVVRMNTCTA